MVTDPVLLDPTACKVTQHSCEIEDRPGPANYVDVENRI